MTTALKASGSVYAYRVLPENTTAYDYVNSGETKRYVLPGTWLPQGGRTPNLVLYSAASIAGELLRGAPDGKPYRLAAAYIEFENNSGTPVSPPANTDRSAGLSYYAALQSHATRDYLRVPLTAAILDSTDEVKYPRGNRVTCFAETSGTAGVHGKAFSSETQSRVYGGALVATPVYANASQDLVYSRFYFADTDSQLVQFSGSQIAVRWPIVLE